MTAPRRAARLLGSVVVLAATALGPRGASAVEQAEPVLELAAQSAGVDVGGTFSVAVLPAGMPADTELRVTVHDRVRTRTELGTSSEGEGLRRSLHTTTVPLGTLPAGADGRRELGVSLAPATPAGRAVTEPGVYPVALDAVAPSGRQLARVITHLVLRPPASQGTPLAVAVLAHIGAPPRPPDEPALDAAEVADATGLVDALAAVPDVTATLAVTPDTLSELALSGDPEAVALVDALRTAATSRPLLALPYVATSPDALADADLEAELVEQLDHGAAVVRDLLGTTPTQATWIAGSDLGATGLELLSSLGVRRAVVAPGRVDRVTDGVLTPARPFVLAPPRPARGRAAPDPDTPIQALLTDTRLADALEGDEEPALIASHVLAELAMLWFEQPGTPRSIVLELDPEVPREAARGVLDGLRAGSLFRPVALDDAFAEAAPLAGVDGDPLRRALDPEDPEEISTSVADGIIGLRGLRGSIEATVGPRGPTLAALDAHLLRATALGLDSRQRRAELDAARASIDGLVEAIGTPPQVTITLTAREGTVPLTIRNDTGGPVDVQVRLRSPKVELPGGDTFAMTLAEDTTRLDIAVRTRASGSFPFEVEVTSPDGKLELASTRYSVRSTAVSGVGLVLSAGAGLFLVVWWARHWREHRRSTKLVASPGDD